MSTDVVSSVVVGELTSEDIAALRAADNVTFHHLRKSDGPHSIRAYLRAYGEPPIYTARQQRLFPESFASYERMRSIAVESQASGYSTSGMGEWSTSYGAETDVRAFASVSTINPSIRTMLGLLRAGDVITLEWVADNNTDALRDAGMHSDFLRLHVRGAKGRDLSFYVSGSVGPDNTARMVRRHG